jgi:hypothetical protein
MLVNELKIVEKMTVAEGVSLELAAEVDHRARNATDRYDLFSQWQG